MIRPVLCHDWDHVMQRSRVGRRRPSESPVAGFSLTQAVVVARSWSPHQRPKAYRYCLSGSRGSARTCLRRIRPRCPRVCTRRQGCRTDPRRRPQLASGSCSFHRPLELPDARQFGVPPLDAGWVLGLNGVAVHHPWQSGLGPDHQDGEGSTRALSRGRVLPEPGHCTLPRSLVCARADSVSRARRSREPLRTSSRRSMRRGCRARRALSLLPRSRRSAMVVASMRSW